MVNKTFETFEDLLTLKQLDKKLDSEIRQLYVFNRFGKLNGRYSREEAVNQFSNVKVFNYYRKEPTICEVYIDIH